MDDAKSDRRQTVMPSKTALKQMIRLYDELMITIVFSFHVECYHTPDHRKDHCIQADH